MSATHFRELKVWKLAMELAKCVYELTAQFPVEERYGLSLQARRSAVSIPSNVAEGNGRSTTREYSRFVSIALGSSSELQTQLLLAKELAWGEADQLDHVLELCDRVGQMLQRLHQALNRKIASESRVPSPESRHA